MLKQKLKEKITSKRQESQGFHPVSQGRGRKSPSLHSAYILSSVSLIKPQKTCNSLKYSLTNTKITSKSSRAKRTLLCCQRVFGQPPGGKLVGDRSSCHTNSNFSCIILKDMLMHFITFLYNYENKNNSIFLTFKCTDTQYLMQYIL